MNVNEHYTSEHMHGTQNTSNTMQTENGPYVGQTNNEPINIKSN